MKLAAQDGQSSLMEQCEFEDLIYIKPIRRVVSDRRMLPTNTTTRKYPIHRWFNFVAGFSPEFVDSCISALPTRRCNTLLDPFTGCGTAQVEGLRNGMNVIGYEANPFFARIARAKLGRVTPEAISKLRCVIEDGMSTPAKIECLADGALIYLRKMYSDGCLAQLLGARNRLLELSSDDLGYLALSKIFDHASHSATDGIYKAPTSRKTAKSPETALKNVFAMLMDDAKYLCSEDLYRRIFGKSSESMTEVDTSSVDIIVTSPPYLNNFDFAEMTRQYLYFWGAASSWSDISVSVRSKLIVNTTTALKGHRDKQQQYKSELCQDLHESIDCIVSALNSEKRVRAGKKDYDLLLYPYFLQMSLVLRECLRVLRKGGHFHMMVSDAALYGVHVPSPQFLAQIMKNLGFSDVSCVKVRDRGHRWVLEKRDGSPIGLGEYHIEARK